MQTTRGQRIGLIAAGLLTALLVWLTVAGAQAATLKMTFKSKALVTGRQIRLGHLLASISGPTTSKIAEIKRIEVDLAPLPGRTKTLDPAAVEGLISPLSLGVSSVQAQLPARLRVERAGQRVSSARMVEAFKTAVEDNLSWVPDRVEVEAVRAPKELILPAGELELRAQTRGRPRMPGRVSMQLDFVVNGRVLESKRISGTVRFFQRTVVAAGPLERGTILKASDLNVTRLELRESAGRFFSDPKKVVGLRLKTDLRPGQAIRTGSLAKPIWMKRGDRVVLLAEQGRLKITAPGLVKAARASQGDQIKVLNLTTGREVYGLVTAPQTVKVFF